MILAIFPYFFVKKPRFSTAKPTFFASNYEKIAQKTWQVYKLFQALLDYNLYNGIHFARDR
jgi:hypothetical protein